MKDVPIYEEANPPMNEPPSFSAPPKPPRLRVLVKAASNPVPVKLEVF